MSKTDAMRALREARRASTPTAAPRVAATPAAAPARTASAAPVEAADGLCGHRNMGGRSCTRPADHVKDGTKSHRYG